MLEMGLHSSLWMECEGGGWTSEKESPGYMDLGYQDWLFPGLHALSLSLQFVCVESLVTAVVDMYPKVFRRGYRRELLILALSIISYFLGLVMLTEVSGVSRVLYQTPAPDLRPCGCAQIQHLLGYTGTCSYTGVNTDPQ